MKDSFQNIVINSFPNILEVEFNSIQKLYLKVIFLNTIFIFTLLFTAAFFIHYKDFLELQEYSLWVFLIITLLLLFVVIFKLIGFKKRKYIVREKDVSYKQGVFFKKLTTVPFNRIQHVEIDQGPISRLFNLASLSVFTAGDSSDDLKISGLLLEEAAQIKEFISTQIDG